MQFRQGCQLQILDGGGPRVRWWGVPPIPPPILDNPDKFRIVKICFSITLCNKDSGEWDISTDSTSLGLTDTQMNTRFAARIFLQWPIFFLFFPTQNVAFMVLKTTSTISGFQCKNWFEIYATWPEIYTKLVFDFLSQTKLSAKNRFKSISRNFCVEAVRSCQ